jgi:SMI1 / KNR4 family (SUKH-1)
MKKLLDQIIDAKYEENTFFYAKPQRPRPNAPATDDDLRRLDTYLASKGLHAPPSYRMFLSIYNGIQNVLGDGYSLLSVDEVIEKKFTMMQENVDEFPTLCDFVIAAGDTPNFFGFDSATPAGGKGYQLVEISAEALQWRLVSFEDFLVALLAVMEKRIRAAQAAR